MSLSYYSDVPPNYYDPDPDEGIVILESAIAYLQPRWKADEDEQETGDYEAYSILSDCIWKIGEDYRCHFCGTSIAEKKDKYCSKPCYEADRLGL